MDQANYHSSCWEQRAKQRAEQLVKFTKMEQKTWHAGGNTERSEAPTKWNTSNNASSSSYMQASGNVERSTWHQKLASYSTLWDREEKDEWSDKHHYSGASSSSSWSNWDNHKPTVAAPLATMVSPPSYAGGRPEHKTNYVQRCPKCQQYSVQTLRNKSEKMNCDVCVTRKAIEYDDFFGMCDRGHSPVRFCSTCMRRKQGQ